MKLKYSNSCSVNWLFRSIMVLLVAALSSCGPIDKDRYYAKTRQTFEKRTSPRISVFLSLKDEKGPALRFELTNLEVLIDDLWLPLTDAPLQLDSVSIGKSQILLGAQNVTSGLCQRIRMTVIRGEVKSPDRDEYTVATSDSFQVDLPIAGVVELRPQDSLSLFLTWDTEDSILPGASFYPALNAYTPLGDLPVNLLYVSCPQTDTIFVIRTDKNWVVDSFGVKGSPTYMETSTNFLNPLLYVLTPTDREIKAINLNSYQTQEFYQAQLNDAPSSMAISPDGRAGFLLDERTGFLSRIDLVSGSNSNRIQIGYRPSYMTYLEELNLLAISLAFSQEVILVEPNSFGIVAKFSTGRTPFALTVANNQLYIAETQDETVSVFDLTTKRNLGQIFVGIGPRYIQKTNNQIFVSNANDGTLSVLSQGQLLAIDTITGLGRPQAMAYAEDYQRLYVADEDRKGVAVIDTVSNRIIDQILLGAKPSDLLMVQ